MIKDYYNVICVMSETSLDEVELAHIQFHLYDQKLTLEILTICFTWRFEITRRNQCVEQCDTSENRS
jgi:hypothetical protein